MADLIRCHSSKQKDKEKHKKDNPFLKKLKKIKIKIPTVLKRLTWATVFRTGWDSKPSNGELLDTSQGKFSHPSDGRSPSSPSDRWSSVGGYGDGSALEWTRPCRQKERLSPSFSIFLMPDSLGYDLWSRSLWIDNSPSFSSSWLSILFLISGMSNFVSNRLVWRWSVLLEALYLVSCCCLHCSHFFSLPFQFGGQNL